MKGKGGFRTAGNKKLALITTQLKRMSGATHVKHTLKNTFFMTLKLDKTQEPTP